MVPFPVAKRRGAGVKSGAQPDRLIDQERRIRCIDVCNIGLRVGAAGRFRRILPFLLSLTGGCFGLSSLLVGRLSSALFQQSESLLLISLEAGLTGHP